VILYFCRHGRAAPTTGDDESRTLTDEGRHALRSAGVVWRRLNLRPDVVLSSPLVRARQTAELVSHALDADAPIPDERLRPGAGWSDFAQALAAHPDRRRILFVGHEPDLSSVVALLTGAQSVRMRPGGIACLEFPGVPEPGAGELAWLLDPDLYTDDR
jgi:phosphohistidine phosphatase